MLDACCMLSYLIVSSALGGRSPYRTGKEARLESNKVICSGLHSELAVELGFEIRFV